MSKSNAFETACLQRIFNRTEFAFEPLANLYVSLHTGDPGEAGTQATLECAYTGYARQPVERSGTGFTVSGAQASNTGAITFPTCVSGSETASHFAVGTAINGAGTILYSGTLNTPTAIGTNVTPTFAAGTLIIVED
jgi:hypothetical protein